MQVQLSCHWRGNLWAGFYWSANFLHSTRAKFCRGSDGFFEGSCMARNFNIQTAGTPGKIIIKNQPGYRMTTKNIIKFVKYDCASTNKNIINLNTARPCKKSRLCNFPDFDYCNAGCCLPDTSQKKCKKALYNRRARGSFYYWLRSCLSFFPGAAYQIFWQRGSLKFLNSLIIW